jgi:non-specific serine/threonine protein kinase
LFGAGEAALGEVGSTVWPSNRADYQHWARIAQRALGENAWTAAFADGGLLGADSVIDQSPSEPAAAASHRGGPAVSDLTRREREVAQLAAQGLSNRRIAEVLTIAEKTAANHLQNALDKLDVHSRSALAARAVELGLAPGPRSSGV